MTITADIAPQLRDIAVDRRANVIVSHRHGLMSSFLLMFREAVKDGLRQEVLHELLSSLEDGQRKSLRERLVAADDANDMDALHDAAEAAAAAVSEALRYAFGGGR